MALHSLYCADVPLRNCSLTHSRLGGSWGGKGKGTGGTGAAAPLPPSGTAHELDLYGFCTQGFNYKKKTRCTELT